MSRVRVPKTGTFMKQPGLRVVPPPEPAARLVRTETPRLSLWQRLRLRLGGVVRVRRE